MSVLCSTSIYGLKVQLNQKIPGIVCKDDNESVDVRIRLGSFPLWFESHSAQSDLWYRGPKNEQGQPRLIVWKLIDQKGYHFVYADNTEFLVDETATEVWAKWPVENLTVEDAATYLLGPIMGFLLLLRGCVSLHGSAIAVGNSAVAIVGPAGSGKSTTAAAFADLGYEVLTEDVLTLNEQGNFFLVEPGYPCIRLWPDSVRTLWGDEVDLPRLTPTWDKRFLNLARPQYRFRDHAIPLKTIYIIEPGLGKSESPRIRTMTKPQALLALVRNTYVSYLMKKQMRATEFKLLTRLLRSVAVKSLAPHNDPSRIPDLCQTIREDIGSLNREDDFPQIQLEEVHV